MNYQARLTDEWIPVPQAVLRDMGWKEGDRLGLEIVGDTLLVTLVEPAPARPVTKGPKTKQ